MDASALFITVAAALILVISWVSFAKYLYSYDQSEEKGANLYAVTFHVESLRFCAFIAFILVMLIGTVITEKSGLDTIPDPTATVIFQIFGMNHSCNVMDHNPAKMISAILLTPFCQLPLMLYCIVWHHRLAKAHKAGKVAKWLLDLSRILTPFNFIAMAELHLWFVNGPADTYGFVAHYIPYMMFQLALIFMMLLNILYLSAVKSLPFGIPSWLAMGYCIAFTIVTIICMTFVISTLVTGEEGLFRDLVLDYLSKVWLVCAILATLVLSYIESKDGNTTTLSINDDDGAVVSLPSSDDRGSYGAI